MVLLYCLIVHLIVFLVHRASAMHQQYPVLYFWKPDKLTITNGVTYNSRGASLVLSLYLVHMYSLSASGNKIILNLVELESLEIQIVLTQ